MNQTAAPLPGGDDIFALLRQGLRGDRRAANQGWALAAPRLHEIARALLARERANSVRATGLITEAWMRLSGAGRSIHIESEVHFYALAKRAMGQFLCDRGRRRNVRHAYLRDLAGAAPRSPRRADPAAAIALQDSFNRLKKVRPHAAEAAWLHCVEGLSWRELEEETGRPSPRLRREKRFAIDWLRDRLH